MELRQLRYFLAVAADLNFTRAAARIGIAQPPLSQQISALEKEIGTPLFTRSKRGVTLTAAGDAFIAYAQRAVTAAEKAADVARGVSRGQLGLLSVGAVFSALYTVVPPTLRILLKSHPQIQVQFQEMTIRQQVASLEAGQIDLAILRGNIHNANITTYTLMNESFVAALPPEHPLTKNSEVALTDLAKYPFIIVSPSFNRDFSRITMSMFAQLGGDLNIIQEVADMHTLLAFVGADIGVAVVPASMQALNISSVAYRPLIQTTATTSLRLAWLKETPSKIVMPFVEAAREAIKSKAINMPGAPIGTA